MKTVYIALGSNLGDRVANLLEARERMKSSNLKLTRASSIYETEPRGFLDQPWFLNQVVEAQTTLYPRQLLARLLQIEKEMGRERIVLNGPRLIDLDILLFGDSTLHLPGLEIPHPRMTERRFVLEPLLEIAPGIRIGNHGPARELLAAALSQSLERI